MRGYPKAALAKTDMKMQIVFGTKNKPENTLAGSGTLIISQITAFGIQNWKPISAE